MQVSDKVQSASKFYEVSVEVLLHIIKLVKDS